MQNDKRNNSLKTLCFPYELKLIKIDEHNSIPDFGDFKPSWQNSLESIERTLKDFICLGVFPESKLIGYGVFEPMSGDVTQIAVGKQ